MQNNENKQPRPFDRDEARATPQTAFEACEAAWLLAHGKTIETMTPEDVAAVQIACGRSVPGEHQEKRTR